MEINIKYEEIIIMIGRAVLKNGLATSIINNHEFSCMVIDKHHIQIRTVIEEENNIFSEKMYIEYSSITEEMHFTLVKEGFVNDEYIKKIYNGIIMNDAIYIQNE